MSKGSGRRPSCISNEKFAENWDRIFSKKSGYFVGFNGKGIVFSSTNYKEIELSKVLLGYYNTPEKVEQLISGIGISPFAILGYEKYEDVEQLRKNSNFISCFIFDEFWMIGNSEMGFQQLNIDPIHLTKCE